jgi:hypothetical protein
VKPLNPTDLTNTITGLLSHDIAEYADKYTKQLKQEATAAGWPPIVVLQLEATLRGGLWTVLPPDSIKEEITNLEEGIPGVTQPNPVIRTFLKRLENERVQ